VAKIDFSCHFRLKTRSIVMDRAMSMFWGAEMSYSGEFDTAG